MYLLDKLIIFWQSPDGPYICCVPQLGHFFGVANVQGMKTTTCACMVHFSLNCMPTLYFFLFLTLNALEHISSAGNDYMLNGIRLTLFSMASFLLGEFSSSSLTEF